MKSKNLAYKTRYQDRTEDRATLRIRISELEALKLDEGGVNRDNENWTTAMMRRSMEADRTSTHLVMVQRRVI